MTSTVPVATTADRLWTSTLTVMVHVPGKGKLQLPTQMLESEFGIDFTHYKPSTITRRTQ